MIRHSFDLAVCNAMAGSGVKPERSARIVRKTVQAFPRAVFIGVVEASLLLEVRPVEWKLDDTRELRLIQSGPLDKAGVAAIIDTNRLDVVSIDYRVGVQPFINGRRIGMRTRHILIVRGRVDGRKRIRKFRVSHLPPKRFWAIWQPMIRRLGRSGADLGDFNKLARAVALATGKRASMEGLTGILTPWSWRVTNKRVVDVDSDHNAVGITVHHPRKRKEKS